MRKLVWSLVAALALLAGLVVWVRSGEPARKAPVAAVSTEPSAPSVPPKTAGRLSETPDPKLLGAARERMGSAAREQRCGAYALLTDIADARLLAACGRLAEPLDALFAARYGVRPLGAPGETIVLFAKLETFRAFTREQGLPAGYAGFAVGARGVAVFYASDQPLTTFLSTLTHELSHLVSRRALGSDLPPWLSEGLADGIGDTAAEEGFRPLGVRAGGDVMAGRLREAYASRRAGGLERLARLGSGEFDRAAVAFDYEQSALLVRFLLADSELAPRFRSFLATLAAGERYRPEGFIAALGLGWAELDRRFEGWLAAG